jgi:hypothetical protein
MDSSYIIATPHSIFHDKNLSGNAKWILAEILNLLRVERQYCWASNDHFAEVFGLTKTNVSYHIHELENQGWIRVEVVKECNLSDCHLKGRGWHRHIYPLTPLSNLLDSLSKRLDTPIQNIGEPIKSTGTIRKTKEKNISLEVSKGQKPQFGNFKVNFLMEEFQKRWGYPPTDYRPRNEAWNLSRVIDGFTKSRGQEVNEENFRKVAVALFDWIESQDWGERVQHLGTIRRKSVIFLKPKGGTNAGSNQETA